MLLLLVVTSVVLALAGSSLLGVLLVRRIARAGRDPRAAEKRLTPLALEVAFGDGEIPALAPADAVFLAGLLGRYSSRLHGGSRDRISAYFARHGHLAAELEKLHDRRAWRRAAAAYALGDMGSPDAVPGLIAALDDGDRAVRSAAARSLGHLEAAEAVEALVAALATHRVPRGIIGQALLVLGPGAVARLVPLLEVPDPDVRATAAELVGLLGDAGQAERLTGRLGDSSAAVRQQAARALGRLGADHAVGSLERTLSDRAPEVRAAAAEALGAIANPRAFPALLELARRDSFASASAAAHALGRIDPARLQDVARAPEAGTYVLEAADRVALDNAVA